MRQTHKYTLLLFPLIVGAVLAMFWGLGTARASIVLYSLSGNDSYQGMNGYFKATASGYLTSITASFQDNGTAPENVHLIIYEDGGFSETSSNTQTINSTPTSGTWNFSGSNIVSSGTSYELTTDDPNYMTAPDLNTASSQTFGSYGLQLGINGIVYGNSISQPSPSVSFNYPTSTSTPNFGNNPFNWSINLSNLNASDTYTAEIYQNSTSGTLWAKNNIIGSGTSTLQNIGLNWQGNNSFIQGTNYTAFLSLADNSAPNTILATSSVNFTTAYPAVSWNYPTSSSVIDPSFSDWSLNFANLSTSTLYVSDVLIATSSSSTPQLAGYNTNIYSSSGSLTNISISNIYLLQSSSTYISTAELFAPTSTPQNSCQGESYYANNAWNCLIATTTISFSTSLASSLPTSTPATSTFPLTPVFSSSIASTTCSTYGFYGDAVCSAGIFVGTALLMPSTTTLGKWQGLINEIKNKPPVGYFSIAISALQGLKNGTSSLNNSTTAEIAAFSAIFSPLDTGISVVLWLTFVFYLLRRLKHFEL